MVRQPRGIDTARHATGVASATVDADRRTMVVSGWHFGAGVVALDNRVLRIKSHSDSELVVELPTEVSPGSYRLTITVTEPSTVTKPSELSSEPFSATVFAAR
jgi:hypothetical protein